MKQFIKQFPLPVCGLALGLASSGNLLQTYGIGELKGLCGALAAVLLFFMLGCEFFINYRMIFRRKQAEAPAAPAAAESDQTESKEDASC